MSSKRKYCLLIGMLIPCFATAQSKLDSIQILHEVEIIANRYQEIIPSQRLSGDELQSLNSFSVADAIRYFAGVQIKDYGGIGGLKTIDVRSMGSHHLGVFYDGIEIGNAQNGTVDLGKFSLDNIEEISLYNGQKSMIFQSAKDYGSAGTVYLRTRRPKFSAHKSNNLLTIFRTGSFDLINPSILWEHKINDDIASTLNAEFITASGKYKFRHTKYHADGSIANDTTAVRENGDIHSLRLEGGLNGFFELGSWHLKGYFYDSEKGLPGAIVNNVWKNAQRQWDRNSFVQANWQKSISNKYDFMVNAKYANDYMRYQNPDTTLMLIDNQFWQQEIYLATAHKYILLPTWEINLSVDYSWNALAADLVNFVHPTRNTLLTAWATAFEWHNVKAQASLLGTFVFDRVRTQDAANAGNKAEYTPAVFLSYKPLTYHDFNLRAFYKHIFRMPTFNDLYYTDIGNIKLRPEYTTQYNVGMNYHKNLSEGIIHHLNFSVDAYYNEVTDKIVAVPKGGSGGGSLYRWMMMNLGYVEIRGVDLTTKIGWKLPADLYLSTGLNYTYQQAQDFTDKSSPWFGGQIAYIPWHSGSIIIQANRRSWDLNYSFIYVGERYHNSANIRENYSPPWYTNDLTIGKSLNLKKSPSEKAVGKLKISAEINNIFNQAYEVIINYPMPGRNYKLILKWEI